MINPFNILICSNSESSVKKTMDYLEEKKYSIFLAKTESDLLSIIKTKSIQLVLVELDFKNKDGVTITSEIRNLKEIEQPHIIIFSSKQDDYILITAFNSGVDDFILSPIKPLLLEARIANLKKRFLNKNSEVISNQSDKSFYIDTEQYLIITKQGKVSLPRKEFEMINLMYQNTHKVFTRQDFAKLIWNAPEVANSRTIDIHIRNIRKYLGNDIIKTAKGIGYTFNVDLLS